MSTRDTSGRPLASVRCALAIELGANAITVRAFGVQPFQPRFWLSYLSGSKNLGNGDCATSPRGYGTFELGSESAGSVLCYVDGQTGDALLYWTYDDAALLVSATNQRGDAAALHDFFERFAKFIRP